MTNLFKKAAVCTDIHFGLKSNSTQHNEDCLNFIKWFTAKAKAEGCETCIFTGDWHNNRASINIVTLNYSLRALEHLNDNFDAVFFIPGNHDLYYRDKRDVQSVEWARYLSNVHIMNDWQQEGDVIFAPWMVGEDYKRVPKYSGKYMFGHFELPNFFMNAMVQMPDHGEIKAEAFGGIETVFTGHFHKRQVQRNIHYIGNCFPHNYADAGDDQRGMMVLEWGKDPEYFSWEDQPRYRVYQLSDLLQHTDARLQPSMHVRVELDVDISYEEATFIKEEFVGKYKLREITLIPQKQMSDDISFDTQGNIKFESVDTIVTNQLSNINSDQYSPNMLLDIYRNL
jgi:DNA repair exonuclease SbcCD nuclease subunit